MDLTSCPECGLPAQIQWRTVLVSTDGPVEHAQSLCVLRHRLFGSVDALWRDRAGPHPYPPADLPGTADADRRRSMPPLTQGEGTMSITLTDIPDAVEDYLRDDVTVVVSPLVPEDPDQGVLTPGQAARFTITATNGDAATGVRLTNVLYHVTVDHPTAVKLIAPGSAVVFGFSDADKKDPITRGTEVSEIYVENIVQSTLDAGAVGSLNLTAQCVDQGEATITVRVRADIDPDDLFRTGHSKAGKQTADVQ